MRRLRLASAFTLLVGAGLTGTASPIAPTSAHDEGVITPIPNLVRKPGVDPFADKNGCLTCHAGLETIREEDSEMFARILEVARQSGTNNRCVVCHGGNPAIQVTAVNVAGSNAYKSRTKQAHVGTPIWFQDHLGPKAFYPDPGSPWINRNTCGPCHAWEVRVQWQSLMMTEAGKIQGTLWGFGGLSGYDHKWANYDVKSLEGDDVVGTPAFYAYMGALALKEPQVFLPLMRQLPPAPNGGADITADPSKAAYSYLRGECERCHLAVGGQQRHGDYRGLGCSACHIPYSNPGLYQGEDPTLRESRPGHPLVHSIQAGSGTPVKAGSITWTGIPIETCTTCHNRGRRIGVSFQGLMESEYESPWTIDGKPQQKLHGKHYLKLHADLHATKGFVCQDCHTTLDVHSSGWLVGAITAAVEIECSDCHGVPTQFPWELPLGTMDEYEEATKEGPPRGLAEKLPDFMEKGDYPAADDGYLLSARGNPLGNVVRHGDRVRVWLASGAVLELRPLKQLTKEDQLSLDPRVAMVQVPTHLNRMECYACHATWAPQCYGCHLKVDYSSAKRPYDWIAIGADHEANGLTKEFRAAGEVHRIRGESIETRSYLRWEDPAMGQNGEGRIAPIVPGCQTTVTVVNDQGRAVLANHIYRIPNVEGAGPEGQRAIDMAALHPHTIQKRARSCESCHADPKALGYGIRSGAFFEDPSHDHFVDLMSGDGRVIPTGIAPQMNAVRQLGMDWSRFVTEDGQQLQTVGHHLKHSRPLNNEERKHTNREGVCLGCHQEIPTESLAVSLLHHVASGLNKLPRTNAAHSALLHKVLLFSGWGQVLCAVLAPIGGLGLLWWWRRRRWRARIAEKSKPVTP